MIDAIWAVVTLPFRLLGRGVELAGRMAALAVGFGLMVAGVAIGAGSLPLVGVPLFLFGLVLLLRALG